MSEIEYRASLVCKEDPCRNHRGPARTTMLDYQTPFTSWTAAHDHALAMCQKVYGTEHTIIIEAREVGEWHPALAPVKTVDTAALRGKVREVYGDDTEVFVSVRDLLALCNTYDRANRMKR